MCSALTKAAEKNKTIMDNVVGAKNNSEAWKIMTSMVDEDSERAKEQANKKFEELSMNNAKSRKEYIAKAKFLAFNVQNYGMQISDQEISRRVLNGSHCLSILSNRSFDNRCNYSIVDSPDPNSS